TEEIVGVLKAKPAMFYCRICISRLLQVAHAEVQNVLSSSAVTHPTIQFTQGHCVKCGGLRTLFRYMPSTGLRSPDSARPSLPHSPPRRDHRRRSRLLIRAPSP